MLAKGSEHGTVMKFLERERRKSRLDSRAIDYIITKDTPQESEEFSDLVPGLSAVADKRSRRLKAAQIDPEDEEEVSEMMELADDEVVSWEEE